MMGEPKARPREIRRLIPRAKGALMELAEAANWKGSEHIRDLVEQLSRALLMLEERCPKPRTAPKRKKA